MPNAPLARRVHAHLRDDLTPPEDLAVLTLREARAIDGQADETHVTDAQQRASHALNLDALDAAQLFTSDLTRSAALDALDQLANGADFINWDAILDPYGLDTVAL